MTEPAQPNTLKTRCCIAGGGPAGVMLGYILARAGIEVVVLEKHADFLRDFRGDTVHPSTLEVIHELGLLDAFLKLPHEEVRHLAGVIGDTSLQINSPTSVTLGGLANKGSLSLYGHSSTVMAIMTVTGSESRLRMLPLPEDDPARRRPDITRARAVLGWEPKVQLREGLSLCIPYFTQAVQEGASAQPRDAST